MNCSLRHNQQAMIFQFLVLLLILVAQLVQPLPAQAGQRIPVIHYYSSASGATAIGEWQANKQHHTYPDPGAFTKGWTHVVHLGISSNYLFFYNRSNGEGAVAWLNNAGNYATTSYYEPGSFAAGWTHIVALNSTTLFFYNATTGSGAQGQVNSAGVFRTDAVFNAGTFAVGWTTVTNSAPGLFFYNTWTGAAEFRRRGNYRLLKAYEPGNFSTGWTHVTYTGSIYSGESKRLVFYNSSSGALAIVAVNQNGELLTLESYKYTPGFSLMTALDGGHIMLYNTGKGIADYAEVSANGDFRYWRKSGFGKGWSHITYGH